MSKIKKYYNIIFILYDNFCCYPLSSSFRIVPLCLSKNLVILPKTKSTEILSSSDKSDFQPIHHKKMHFLDYDEQTFKV